MVDDPDYLTTYEAALAVVATAMKKARQRIDTLIVNSIIAGILFCSGSMLYVIVEANNHNLFEQNKGLVELIQGGMYPIGLFYVVVMGTDLFNANVLYMTTGLCRGAVTPLDAFISLTVSWWFNLASTLFVCYVICTYSDITNTESFVSGSIDIAMRKVDAGFLQTFLRGISGNFYAALAIYLQLMARPLHVKFLMMFLPVFTFVCMGFTHSVADMYTVLLGVVNGAPVLVRTVAWKCFLPGVLGNLVGGSFFAVVIVYYLHLIVVERDQARLNLPIPEPKDEQPQQQMDSRVLARPSAEMNIDEKMDESSDSYEGAPAVSLRRAISRADDPLYRRPSEIARSPKNVFPVLGMGRPREREASIASGSIRAKREEQALSDPTGSSADEDEPSAEFIGQQLRRVLTRSSIRSRSKAVDLEMRREASNSNFASQYDDSNHSVQTLPPAVIHEQPNSRGIGRRALVSIADIQTPNHKGHAQRGLYNNTSNSSDSVTPYNPD